jgi:hypothetical protein
MGNWLLFLYNWRFNTYFAGNSCNCVAAWIDQKADGYLIRAEFEIKGERFG